MQKRLKFKQEWFEILNQCNRDLRSDVIEAVFQYFFTDAVPSFTDDARRIAFGFIRAEIDAANSRIRYRATKTEAPEAEAAKAEAPKEDITNEAPVEVLPTVVTEPVPEEKPTKEEALAMFKLMAVWNNAVISAEVDPVDMARPPHSPELIPLLHALRIHGDEELADLIRDTDNDDFVEFDEFFRKLSE